MNNPFAPTMCELNFYIEHCRQDWKRRRDWAMFWTGQGIGDMGLIEEMWDYEDEKCDDMTSDIMRTTTFETIRDSVGVGVHSRTKLPEIFALRVWEKTPLDFYVK